MPLVICSTQYFTAQLFGSDMRVWRVDRTQHVRHCAGRLRQAGTVIWPARAIFHSNVSSARGNGDQGMATFDLSRHQEELMTLGHDAGAGVTNETARLNATPEAG
jgi:hypothetical protein